MDSIDREPPRPQALVLYARAKQLIHRRKWRDARVAVERLEFYKTGVIDAIESKLTMREGDDARAQH